MNEKTIWNKLISAGLTFAGTAGLMGNLYAESALNPQNLQNSYEKKLGYTDSIYTQAEKKSYFAGLVTTKYLLAGKVFRAKKIR